MKKHDARGYFAPKQTISFPVLQVLGGQVYIHSVFTRMNLTTMNVDAPAI